ncbi:TIGR01906 family membrane protein [Serpentinicella sp. ANB-PHB4]|uniref:TIGR01906 family membrane protein n=1 Tax=Serpentinicella sp. ANB-PHB4 TaxID=3074076 RepID=UPI00285AFC47|nr:TIGR01906 family membrane protein [Serpentinicella sp. ANB-PHB4]MDR5658620.1 TIGR01906 family membrane protein [Serpentinicella sp. ANB-PHB4]
MKKVVYIIIGCALSIALLLSVVEYVTFDYNHYEEQFEKNQKYIEQYINIEETNLDDIVHRLLGYLNNEYEDLNIETKVNNERRVVFSQREIKHMEDVLFLFNLGRFVRNTSVVLLVILLVYVIKYDQKWKKRLSNTLGYTLLANIILFGLLAIAMRIDFTKYFNYFHYIFFTNDLWILNPNKEILVQILPEAFFYATAVKIGLIYFALLVVMWLISMISKIKSFKI